MTDPIFRDIDRLAGLDIDRACRTDARRGEMIMAQYRNWHRRNVCAARKQSVAIRVSSSGAPWAHLQLRIRNRKGQTCTITFDQAEAWAFGEQLHCALQRIFEERGT